MGTALLALRQMVRDRIGIPAHDEYFRDSVLDSSINLALQAIESEYYWPWNERAEDVVLDASSAFTVPTDWRATRAIFYEGTVLHEMTYYDLELKFSQNRIGQPSHFAVVDRVVYVRPQAGAGTTLKHLYYAIAPQLAGDEDEPRIPDVHIGVLVAKAAQLCSVREDDRPSADSHLAEYLQGIDRMRKEVRRTTRPARIRVRPGGWLGD